RPPCSSALLRSSLFGGGLFSRRFLGRSSSGFGLGGLGSGALFGAFLGLGTRLALLGVAARGAGQEPGAVEEALDAIGRLRAHFEPMLGAVGVEGDALLV